MGHYLLEQHFKNSVQLTEEESTAICDAFTLKKYQKKEFVFTQGSIVNQEFFVVSGCFRVFTLDKKGNESTLYFAVQNWWLMDIDSFMNNTPSNLNVQALEDSEVLFISKTDKLALYEAYPVVEKLFRVMFQKAIVAWQRRLIRNHCETARERYGYFITTYPEIAAKLTDKQIASYLGITHEFLSRFKKENSLE
ncbi:Crp/Fnr family transcriptional regulator [Flavobacterium sp. ASW18X]|uniref:Crp/Fnr family transcriptional regulator n=1 Tax=Flavobacterium sp. ASW18X TaxID=2572595 RepID=UPI0010AECF0A|nr:Crp/Fnr family transcriptional regulator [Flavobacterium sp. ASW18X]TKD61827.1 Crp/Fnr family transcriptional regulator [Flavobacterium sp. ASW18X]